MTGYFNWEVNMVNRVTTADGSIQEDKTPLSYHVCTQEDFDNYSYRPRENQKKVIDGLFPLLYCLDNPKEVFFSGNSVTIQRHVLTVDLIRCSNTTSSSENIQCKPDNEIDKFMSERTVMMVYNSESYLPDQYEEKSIAQRGVKDL